MTSEERQTKHPGGRPSKRMNRNIIKGVRFTAGELTAIQTQSKRVGVKLSTYIRQMALTGNIIPRMNEEERQYFRQLINMSNNLNQLTKKANQDGVNAIRTDLESYKNQINDLLKNFKR